MEALLQQQAAAIDQLNRITINYANDSKSRKTIDYFQKKIKELEDLQREFVANNNELQQYEPFSDQPYFTEKKYDEAMENQSLHFEMLKSSMDRLKSGSNTQQSTLQTVLMPQIAVARENVGINDILNTNNSDEQGNYHYGLVDVLVSDNGTQFKSDEFKRFLDLNGVRHVLTAPGNP